VFIGTAVAVVATGLDGTVIGAVDTTGDDKLVPLINMGVDAQGSC
jgi:hypothetical protein